MQMNADFGRRTLRLATIASLLTPLALSGCGSSQPGRLQGTAAGGAATGALIGIIGGPIGVVVGAGIGAGAGALASTNTTPKQVNLGNPPWQPKEPQTAAIPPSNGTATPPS